MTFDLIIIGAGMTGLTLAAALAEQDCTIAVIDHLHQPSLSLNPAFDLRVSAINHASAAIFQSLGVWEEMQQLRISPYEAMQVWDANSPANIRFDCTEVGQSCLGYIIESAVMKIALLKHLHAQANVQLIHAATPHHISEQVDYISLELNTGDKLDSKLLIGADGSHSWVAAHTGLSSQNKPYQQSALVTTVHTEQAHQSTAWQRFLSTGPVAFLPLSDPQYCSIVWSTTPEQALHLQKLSVPEFNQAITAALEHKLGTVSVEAQRLVFPLQQSHARHYVKPRIALIGDAAHTIHPLAGQGVNLGLLDAACLAEVIEETLNKQRDIGGLPCLRRYERWRKGENQIMISAMAGFKSLFSHQSLGLGQIRHLGFKLTENLPLLKPYLIERAMGLRGDLPKKALFYS